MYSLQIRVYQCMRNNSSELCVQCLAADIFLDQNARYWFIDWGLLEILMKNILQQTIIANFESKNCNIFRHEQKKPTVCRPLDKPSVRWMLCLCYVGLLHTGSVSLASDLLRFVFKRSKSVFAEIDYENLLFNVIILRKHFKSRNEQKVVCVKEPLHVTSAFSFSFDLLRCVLKN